MKTGPRKKITVDEFMKEPCQYCKFGKFRFSLKQLVLHMSRGFCKECEYNGGTSHSVFSLDDERYKLEIGHLVKLREKICKNMNRKFLFIK